MPRKMAGSEMMTIEASTEAMKTPSVVLLRTVHFTGRRSWAGWDEVASKARDHRQLPRADEGHDQLLKCRDTLTDVLMVLRLRARSLDTCIWLIPSSEAIWD
jgi:hypothetical protein